MWKELAWDVLTRLGWLLREEGRVRPSGKVLVGDERDDATEEALDDARQLLAAVLDTVDVGGATSWWGGQPRPTTASTLSWWRAGQTA